MLTVALKDHINTKKYFSVFAIRDVGFDYKKRWQLVIALHRSQQHGCCCEAYMDVFTAADAAL
jgi:hypothetical protein